MNPSNHVNAHYQHPLRCIVTYTREHPSGLKTDEFRGWWYDEKGKRRFISASCRKHGTLTAYWIVMDKLKEKHYAR